MKYRRLTSEELDHLEVDFTKFLVSQSIMPDDWAKLKAGSPEKVEELVGIFSDIVLEKSLSQIHFVEHRSQSEIRVFKFMEDRIVMNSISTDDVNVDFTNPECMQKLAAGAMSMGKVAVLQKEKPFVLSRNEEVFNMLQIGCLIVKEEMFDAIERLYEKDK